ncbi:MAG: hypothetical protein GYB64_11605 [Chloroflexi bacterium]|nr:hypothetical protein [Chloroflexota bacterium]
MSYPNPQTEELGRLLGFNAEDLALNRQGLLSEAQTARLEHDQTTVRGVTLVLFVLAAVTGVSVLVADLPRGFLAAPALLLIVALTGAVNVRKAKRNLTQGSVRRVAGRLRKRRRNDDGTEGWRYPPAFRYYIRVKASRWKRVPEGVFTQVERGRRYALYLSSAGRVLSIEDLQG